MANSGTRKGTREPEARERIVDSSYDLFSRRGIQAVGVDEVIERFGGGAVANREASRQGEEAAHEFLLELRVAGRCIPAQKRVLIEITIPELTPREPL